MTKNDIWGVLAPPRGWFERQIIFWTTRIIFRTEGRNFYNFPKNLRLWVMWGSETKNVKKLIFKRITGICRITKLIERVLAHPATSVSGERSALWLLYSIPLAHCINFGHSRCNNNHSCYSYHHILVNFNFEFDHQILTSLKVPSQGLLGLDLINFRVMDLQIFLFFLRIPYKL